MAVSYERGTPVGRVLRRDRPGVCAGLGPCTPRVAALRPCTPRVPSGLARLESLGLARLESLKAATLGVQGLARLESLGLAQLEGGVELRLVEVASDEHHLARFRVSLSGNTFGYQFRVTVSGIGFGYQLGVRGLSCGVWGVGFRFRGSDCDFGVRGTTLHTRFSSAPHPSCTRGRVPFSTRKCDRVRFSTRKCDHVRSSTRKGMYNTFGNCMTVYNTCTGVPHSQENAFP